MTDQIEQTRPLDPLVILRKLLIEHFNDNELRDLFDDLSIDYEALSSGNKNDRSRDLVTYCQRHGLLPELAQRTEQLRPGIIPPSIKEYISPVQRLDRVQWLRAHGFRIDPFSSEALQAETDPLFNLPGLPAFVNPTNDPSDFEQLIGTLQSPGYRFIFAPAGGGKTSLRQRIADTFNQTLSQWYPLRMPSDPPFVLTVEYILHDYDPRIANARFHIDQIIKLVANRSQGLLNQNIDFHFTQSSALATLENLVDTLKSSGLDGLCILVDNLDSGPDRSPQTIWDSIQAIATRIELLTVNGLMFKFFLPIEVLELARPTLTTEYIYEIQWEQEQLIEVFGQRLISCMDQHSLLGSAKAIDAARTIAFPELFMPGLATRIADYFIDWGYKFRQPAEMWRLGYYLLDEHFQKSPDRCRSATDLIRYGTLDDAMARLTRAETEQRPLIVSPPSTEGLPLIQPLPTEEVEPSGMTNALQRITEILVKWDEAEYNPFFNRSVEARTTINTDEESQGTQSESVLVLVINKLTLILEKLSDSIMTAVSQHQQREGTESLVNEQTMSPQAIVQEINNHIAGNDLSRAFETIRKWVDWGLGTMFEREFTALENRYINGTISQETYAVECNKLTDRIHALLRKKHPNHL